MLDILSVLVSNLRTANWKSKNTSYCFPSSHLYSYRIHWHEDFVQCKFSSFFFGSFHRPFRTAIEVMQAKFNVLSTDDIVALMYLFASPHPLIRLSNGKKHLELVGRRDLGKKVYKTRIRHV